MDVSGVVGTIWFWLISLCIVITAVCAVASFRLLRRIAHDQRILLRLAGEASPREQADVAVRWVTDARTGRRGLLVRNALQGSLEDLVVDAIGQGSSVPLRLPTVSPGTFFLPVRGARAWGDPEPCEAEACAPLAGSSYGVRSYEFVHAGTRYRAPSGVTVVIAPGA